MCSVAVCSEWYLPALLTIVLYLTRLALLLEMYIQRLDCEFKLVYRCLKRFLYFKRT